MKSSLKRNLILFSIMRSFFLPFFWLPVLYFYLVQNKGLSPASALFLLSIQEFLLIFLEIPTGVLADKVSRKLSVAVGYILTALPFVFLPFTNSWWIYILIFSTKAVGKAFISGADTSLLYDLLLENNMEHEYKKIIQRTKAYMTGVSAICIFLGGLIAQYNMNWTLILPFPLMLIGAVAVLMMDEPKISETARKLQDSNYLRHTFNALKYLLSNKYLLIASIVFTVSDALAVNLKWFYSPILGALNFNLTLIGSITAILYLLKSFSSFISNKFMYRSSKKNVIFNNILTALSLLLIVLFFNVPMVILALFGIIYFNEIVSSAIDENIHDQIESKNRSTVVSMISMMGSVMATFMLNGFGFFNDKYSLRYAIAFLCVLFIIAWLMSLKLKETTIDQKNI